MRGVQTRSVAEDDADIRLDRWFKRHFPQISHGRLEKLLRTGQVRVDGRRAKASVRLTPGQVIRVPPIGDTGNPTLKAHRPVSREDRDWINSLVLHIDDALFALNKPPGVPVQGGSGVGRHIDGLLGGLVAEGAEKPRLVHRLDRDTSGVLLVARSAGIASKLGKVFRGRDARKTYWALVAGVPSPRHGRVDAALLKRAGNDGYEKVVADDAMGKKAATDYRVVENAGRRVAWLELSPLTGRTHQLRVHCAGLGTPIIGDRKYGKNAALIDGLPGSDKLHLHARTIHFPHPSGGELFVTAPLPETMENSWEFLGFDIEQAGGDL